MVATKEGHPLFSLHIDYPDDRAELLALSQRIGLTRWGLGAACCFAGVGSVTTLITGRPLWQLLLFAGLALLFGGAAHVAAHLDGLFLDRLDATRDQKETGQC